MTPVTAAGATDSTRPVLYVGQTQVLTPAGALPLSFEVPAASLDEAVAKFGELAKQALARTMKRSRSCAASKPRRSSSPAPPRPVGCGGPAAAAAALERHAMDTTLAAQARDTEIVNDWVVFSDSGDWEGFATVWHDDAWMTSTWFQGPATEFQKARRAGFERGVSIIHFLGGTSIDVAG